MSCCANPPPVDVSPPTYGVPATSVPKPSPCCCHIVIDPDPRVVVVDGTGKIEVTCE